MKRRVRKAVIPAAGLGTRFLPATKAIPKEMLPIVDKPAIQMIVEEAVDSGIEEILIITGRGKGAIENHFDNSVELELELWRSGDESLRSLVQKTSDLANVHYVRQKERKGLGHAVYHAKTFVGGEHFAVMLPDDLVYSETPCLKQLMRAHRERQATVVGVQRVGWDSVEKYGVVEGTEVAEGLYKVAGLVEKPSVHRAPSNIAVLSRYIIAPEIFNVLENTKPGAGGEVQLTDALNTLAKQGDVYAYAFQGRRYDAGDKQGYLEAVVEYALRDTRLGKDFAAYLADLAEGGYR